MDAAGNGSFGILRWMASTNVEIVGEGAASEVKHKATRLDHQSAIRTVLCEGCDYVTFSRYRPSTAPRGEPGFVGQERMSGMHAFQSIQLAATPFENVCGDGVRHRHRPGDGTELSVSVGVPSTSTYRDNDFLEQRPQRYRRAGLNEAHRIPRQPFRGPATRTSTSNRPAIDEVDPRRETPHPGQHDRAHDRGVLGDDRAGRRSPTGRSGSSSSTTLSLTGPSAFTTPTTSW